MDMAAWLRELGLERYEPAFRENEIDWEVLPELSEADLEKVGLSLGARKKLLKAIAQLPGKTIAPSPKAEPPPRPVRPEAERRQLTVLFCDLVGSTELSARLDPEEMREIVGAYQGNVTEVVRRWEGHVAKYMGDGALAYFGWPQAHEDDAERAVRAGLELVQTIAALRPATSSALQVRIGIATGNVVVGDLGGQEISDKDSVVGETPNLASRLQSVAEPGSIVISQATRKLVGSVFELDDLGPQRFKGFAEPLAVWRICGEGEAEGRFEARHRTGLTPLVGRDEELSLLLSRWEQVKDGEGQVVLLSGEPGIGKSRLVRELRARFGDGSHRRLTYQCSPHHTTSPLHPVIEQLERAVGFERDDPPEARLDKLERLLMLGSQQLDQAVPLIATLLGIPPDDRYLPLDLTPQRRKQRTLEVLLEQLQGLAAEQTILLVYEDVHWIDPTSQELLGMVIEQIERLPVLLLITFRPEFKPPWSGLSHLSTLALTRLGRCEGAAMVDRVVGEKPLPPLVADQIVAKTDGVPLFVEELTKTVLEAGLLRETENRYELSGPLPPLAIPANLHDSLLARLDRLAPAKEVAQIGAVIGREFSHELLAAVAPMSTHQLGNALQQLVSSKLVFRRGVPPEAIYTFKHALVQDAAYGTLLKSRRQQLHARIAQTLKERFADVVQTQPEAFAHHCTQAGLLEEAVSYWYKAGQQSMARSAMVEATAQLTRALDVLAGLPLGPDRDRKELDLQIALGAALISTKSWAAPAVGATYARARELCTGESDFPQLLAALSGLFAHHLHCSSKHVALEVAEELLRVAERSLDRPAQAAGHRFLAVTLLFRGQLLAALKEFERALSLYDPACRSSLVYLWGPDARVSGGLFTALILMLQGYPDQALLQSREALAAAYALGHAYTTCQALYLTGWLHQLRGDEHVVRERATTLVELTTEHALSAWSAEGMVLHGWALAEGGATRDGIAELRRGLAKSEALGVQQHTPSFLGLLAGLYTRTNDHGEALKLLDEALARVKKHEERWFEAELHRLKGEALLRYSPKHAAEAEACFRTAMAVAQQQGAQFWKLRATTGLAQLWADQGRDHEALDLLAPVYGWFTEGFDIANLKEAKALLDGLR